jgi:hypothetical protein
MNFGKLFPHELPFKHVEGDAFEKLAALFFQVVELFAYLASIKYPAVVPHAQFAASGLNGAFDGFDYVHKTYFFRFNGEKVASLRATAGIYEMGAREPLENLCKVSRWDPQVPGYFLHVKRDPALELARYTSPWIAVTDALDICIGLSGKFRTIEAVIDAILTGFSSAR